MKLTGDEAIFGSVEDLLETELEDTEWVIDPFLPAGGRMLLYGETGEGKSQLAMTVGFAVLTGDKFLNEFQCRQGPIVYIQADMPLQEWHERLSISAPALPSLEGFYQIYYPGGLDVLAEAKNVKSELAEFIRSINPVLVIVDVLSETHKEDENDNSTPGAVYRAWQAVVGHRAGILFVHHEKKPQTAYNGSKPSTKYAFSGAHKWLDLSSSSWRIYARRQRTEIWLENPKAARNSPRIAPIRLNRTEQLLMKRATGAAVTDWLHEEIRLRRHTKAFLVKEACNAARFPDKTLQKTQVYELLKDYGDPE